MPKEVEECVSSVLEDNPDYSESRAYAICNAKHNRGELSNVRDPDEIQVDEDPCWEGYTMVGTKTDENGNEVPRCVPDDDVPDANMADGSTDVVAPNTVFTLADIDTEPIERVEEGGNKVRYTNLKLLSPGVWTDSASRETVWYSPDGIKNLEIAEDNTVNIMHDADNDVSAAGEIDPDSVQHSDDGVFADVVIDTSSAAGQYADENLQKTLETEGVKGFGGPSVEISAEGQEVEFNAAKGMKELVGGIIDGLGFVKNPASKPVSFARQVTQRGVALSDAESEATVMQKGPEAVGMDPDDRARILEAIATRELQMENIEEHANMIADELGVGVDEVMEVLDPLMDMGEEEEDTEAGDDEEEEEMPDDEEDEDTEMQGDAIEVIQEQIDDLWDALDEMKESMMSESDLSDQLDSVQSDLADAETVAELNDAKDELDKRLSELEDQPENPRAMADGDGENDGVEGTVTEVAEYDDRTQTLRR